jgi:AcrR family transcriptional regulator
MGVAERKEREREALRKKIIQAATELFREVGYEAVSMRKIARRVEYSVGSLYLHYRDKDELFFAVQQAAFRTAFAYIEQITADADPMDRLMMLGQRYVRFGVENPDLYRLMFMMEGPMEALEENEQWRSGLQLHNLLTDTVTDCIESGQIRSEHPDGLSFGLWSLVHGMVSLRISNRIHIYNKRARTEQTEPPDLDHLLQQTYQLMMNFIRTH